MAMAEESKTDMVTGFVYQLRNLLTNERFYIGSCVNPRNRFYLHISEAYNENRIHYDLKKSQYIRGVSDRENIDQYIIMETLEEVVYENKRELEEREQFWINELKPTTNMRKALRTKEELKIYEREKSKKYVSVEVVTPI